MPGGLSLAQAVRICEATVATCTSRGFGPITVVVMDPAGHVISMQRMDNCAPTAYPKFAQAKAFTCVSLGVSTRVFRDKYTAAKDPAKFCQMLSMGDLTGGQVRMWVITELVSCVVAFCYTVIFIFFLFFQNTRRWHLFQEA